MSPAANTKVLLVAALTAPAMIAAACGETAVERVEFPLVASGGSSSFEVGGWEVTLARADVGLGPVYFCTSPAADAELCGTAAAEFLPSVTVDALAEGPVDLGTVEADTRTVRSATLDFGLSWPVTAAAPVAGAGAPEGHAAVFEGEATRGGDGFAFTLAVDLAPANPGDLTVSGVRTEHPIDESTAAVLVTLSPGAWWEGVDFDALFLASAFEEDGPLTIDPASAAAGVVRSGLATRAPPAFTWSREVAP